MQSYDDHVSYKSFFWGLDTGDRFPFSLWQLDIHISIYRVFKSWSLLSRIVNLCGATGTIMFNPIAVDDFACSCSLKHEAQICNAQVMNFIYELNELNELTS
jgi:hypothetical protein